MPWLDPAAGLWTSQAGPTETTLGYNNVSGKYARLPDLFQPGPPARPKLAFRPANLKVLNNCDFILPTAIKIVFLLETFDFRKISPILPPDHKI